MANLTRPGGMFDYGPGRSRLLLRVMRTLGQGRPLPPEQVEQIIAESGIVRDDAHQVLGQVAERGPDDTLVGILGLSLRETPHRFTVDGRRLFTWCAADTLFLPSLLGRTASIESHSPVSPATIRLTVSPRRVEAVDPVDTVVSMVVADPDAADLQSVEALWSTFCHQIFFFGTRQEAEGWAVSRGNPDSLEIVSVDEAFKLGQLLASTLLAHATAGAR
jgi:alkylmercury lyase